MSQRIRPPHTDSSEPQEQKDHTGHGLPMRTVVGYTMASVSGSILGTLFGVYQLAYFLEVVRVPSGWWVFGHAVYAVWNSLNDVLAGFVSDRLPHNRRLPVILWGGLIWVLSFCFAWAAQPDWPEWVRGIHFILSLSLIDGCYSAVAIAEGVCVGIPPIGLASRAVDLHTCCDASTLNVHDMMDSGCPRRTGGALLAELTPSDSQRIRLHWITTLASLASRLPLVYTASLLWTTDGDLGPYRAFAYVCAVLAAGGFIVSSQLLREQSPAVKPTPGGHSTGLVQALASETRQLWKVAKEVFRSQSFVRFVGMNFIQENIGQWNWQMLPVFLTHMCGWLSSGSRGLIMSGTSACASFGTLALLMLVNNGGGDTLWMTYMRSFYLRVSASVLLLVSALWSPSDPMSSTVQQALVVMFLVVNIVSVDSPSALFPVTIGQLIDADAVAHRRPRAMGGSLYALHALVAKPGNSLFPVMGYWFLSYYGYPPDDGADTSGLATASFYLLVGMTGACAIVQWLVWRGYMLRGQRLRAVKDSITASDTVVSA